MPGLLLDLPEVLRRRPAASSLLDEEGDVHADPCAGWEIGRCEVIRRLRTGATTRLLALRSAPEGNALVLLDQIEWPEATIEDLLVYSESAAALRHPNLARVFDCEVTEEGTFWVSEFVPGATLAEITEACRKNGKSLPLGVAVAAVYEAALAMSTLHGHPGFAHGLVRADSIVVAFDGRTRLVDVGMFPCLERTPESEALSPEQGRGLVPDARSDVFALGAVLYECLTGHRPWNGDRAQDRVLDGLAPPSCENVAVERELDQVVMRALKRDRTERFANAGELAEALRRAASPFM